MIEEKFKIIQFIRELIVLIDKELDNFPKKDIELKNRIRNSSYNVLEFAYKANVVTNINRFRNTRKPIHIGNLKKFQKTLTQKK